MTHRRTCLHRHRSLGPDADLNPDFDQCICPVGSSRRMNPLMSMPFHPWAQARVLIILILLGSAISGWSEVLTHGPVTGGVTASGANVFVRTDSAATVTLHYSTDPLLTTFQSSNSFSTDVSSDFTKIIPLSGLNAETPYYLDVLVNGVSQCAAPYPTFTTFAPAGASKDFKFVVLTDFTSVAKLDRTYDTFASAAALSPAFVFLGGDFDHTNPANLDDKRTMFKNLYGPTTLFMDGFVPKILRQFAIAHQWDDHDAGANNVDKDYPGWSLTQQAFQEYVPTYPLPSVSPGIWQRFSYAQVDFFLLDCRSQRDSGLDPDGPNKSMLDGNNLGATGELQWLENGLLTSTATWKIVFTSVVTNPTTKANDAWGAFQYEWNVLRNYINGNHIQNVVFIAGDLHLAAIDNGTASGFPEMCLPQANTDRTNNCATGMRGVWSEGYYDAECAGFGLITVAQNPDRVTLQTLGESGNVTLSYTVSSAATPTITTQPKNAIALPDQTARFTVKATGAAPLSYQWQKNGNDIPGATSSVYVTPPVTADDNGSLFLVVVSNSLGSVQSQTARLSVALPPTITVQPADRTVAVGRTARFTVAATGTKTLTYQWRRNGNDISGATSPSYTTPPTTADDSGSLFSVVVTNPYGMATSRNALLTVK